MLLKLIKLCDLTGALTGGTNRYYVILTETHLLWAASSHAEIEKTIELCSIKSAEPVACNHTKKRTSAPLATNTSYFLTV